MATGCGGSGGRGGRGGSGGTGADLSVDVASLSITHHNMHLIMGAVSLWTRPPALYLCTGPKKVAPSTHRRHELINLATSQKL